MDGSSPLTFRLPARFEAWFAARGWSPRPHQLALAEATLRGESALLIAPTGGGKTLAGFLGSLVELARPSPPTPSPLRERGLTSEAQAQPPGAAGGGAAASTSSKRPRLQTLYISPLKALAADVARNLMLPVAEMGLDIRIETRTGDTASHVRQRQRKSPPDILLTTPEQLALLIASDHAAAFFADLRCVIIDEIHALAPSKRGDLLALGLATLAEWAPECRFIGLSATVREPEVLAGWLDVRVRGASEGEGTATPLPLRGRGAGVRGQRRDAAPAASPSPPTPAPGRERGL
ncbi:DEAD/DEAH box helicase, partial [Hyphomonas sp.]|uniref:DEAD/DEAH box helicase n=1 Tax=Hyphomonas sp. TaxID=87 RepID=UPI00391E022B